MDLVLVLVLSFAPMLLYTAVLWWLDRYEKEPLHLLATAFLWGAIPSIILAIILELVLDVPLLALATNQLLYELVGSSVIAPLVEESIKAVALFALLLFARYELNGPVDGLIYGGIVGFGFAAVENLFYLGGAYAEGGLGSMLGLAFLRAGLFGLNHAMYTGFTGLGIALASESRRKWLRLLLILAGFTVAVGMHAFHNATATFWGHTETENSLAGGIFFVTLVGDWTGVVVLLLVALWSFFLEQGRIVRYAEALVSVHAIPAEEIAILRSTTRRNINRLKALLALDLRRWWQLTRYYHKVTEAAYAWHRVQQGDDDARERLRRLQREFIALRRDLVPNAKTAVQ